MSRRNEHNSGCAFDYISIWERQLEPIMNVRLDVAEITKYNAFVMTRVLVEQIYHSCIRCIRQHCILPINLTHFLDCVVDKFV